MEIMEKEWDFIPGWLGESPWEYAAHGSKRPLQSKIKDRVHLPFQCNNREKKRIPFFRLEGKA